MRLQEFFILLEQRDRLAHIAKVYRGKLLKHFQSEKWNSRLRGDSATSIENDLKRKEEDKAVKDMVEFFSDADPSKNKKYTDWILRQWLNGKLLWEDVYKMETLLTDFEQHRKSLEKKDLNQYKDYRDLEEALEPHRGKAVAGIRVKNFLKKDELQKLTRNIIADPDDPKVKKAYENWKEEYPENPPEWFENELYNDALELYKDELNPEDYADDDAYLRDIESGAASYTNDVMDEQWADARKTYEDTVLRKTLEAASKVPEVEKVYVSDRLAVLVPNSEKASCYLGKGTEWCTAATQIENYFWEYRPDGPLYVILTDKLGKYQFHFETAQFMDEHDRSIEDSGKLTSLVKNYPELREAFSEKAKKYYEIWLLDSSDIEEETWNLLAAASGDNKEAYNHLRRVLPNSTEISKLIIRAYKGHKDDAPEGWAQRIKQGIIKSENIRSITMGWLSKEDLTLEDINQLVSRSFSMGIGGSKILIDWLKKNEIDIPLETWTAFVRETPRTLFHIPTEMVTRNMLEIALYHTTTKKSILHDLLEYYYTIHASSIVSAIPNAEKFLSLVNAEDIKYAIDRKTEDLQLFNDYFGEFPWLYAVEKAATKKFVMHDIAQSLFRMVSLNEHVGRKSNLDIDKIINAMVIIDPNTLPYVSKLIKNSDVALSGLQNIVKNTIEQYESWEQAKKFYDEMRKWMQFPENMQKELLALIKQKEENERNAQLARQPSII